MSGKIRVYKLRLRKSDTSARQEFVGTRHEAEARLRSWMSTDPIEHRAEIDPIEIPIGQSRHSFRSQSTCNQTREDLTMVAIMYRAWGRMGYCVDVWHIGTTANRGI